MADAMLYISLDTLKRLQAIEEAHGDVHTDANIVLAWDGSGCVHVVNNRCDPWTITWAGFNNPRALEQALQQAEIEAGLRDVPPEVDPIDD